MAVSSLYWAVQLLPLADVAVLTFMAPVFVAAVAPLVLGERASRGVALAMPLCIGGVVLVAQPTFLFGSSAVAVSAVGVAVALMQASVLEGPRRGGSSGGAPRNGSCMPSGCATSCAASCWWRLLPALTKATHTHMRAT